MNGFLRQPIPQNRPVVAFDFDGTLTYKDSFLAFLAWKAGLGGFIGGVASLAPAALAYGVNRDRGALKAKLVSRFLKGTSRITLEEEAARFRTQSFNQLIRPDALKCWRDWRGRGARVIIVTASPEIIVAPFAKALGANDLIGTRLDFDDRDRLTGRLEGPNCRGPEKVSRLIGLLGDEFQLEAAYGDTSGDREMLELAETRGYRAFTGRP